MYHKLFYRVTALFSKAATAASTAAPLRKPLEKGSTMLSMDSYQVSYSLNIPTREEPAVHDKWWEIRGDSRLNRLVELALANNPGLSETLLKLNRLLFKAGLIKADLLRGVDKACENGGNNWPEVRCVRTFGGEFCTGYELELWEQLAEAENIDQWTAAAALEDQAAVKLALVNNLVDAYYHLAYLTDSVEAARTGSRTLKQIQLMFSESGETDRQGLERLKRSINTSENRLLELQSKRRLMKEYVCELAGLEEDDDLALAGASLFKAHPVPVDLDIPLWMLCHRPDLKKAAFEMSRLFVQPEIMSSFGWFPALSLKAGIRAISAGVKTTINGSSSPDTVIISLDALDQHERMPGVSEGEYEDCKFILENALSLALSEIDIYCSAYAKARENLAQSENRYARDWQTCSSGETWNDTGHEQITAGLNAARNAETSRLAMLKNRYQIIQYENMIYKAIAGYCPANQTCLRA